MLVTFWAAVGVVVFTYAVMPALILLRGVVRTRPYVSHDASPSVSVLIAAYNEEASITSRVENLLACDYEVDRTEIVVASDGSTDGTVAAVAAAAKGDSRVRVVDLPRQGKAAALNAAAAAATGEVLVFTDANSVFAPDALRALTRPFADPDVGGVAGDQRYLHSFGADAIADGERRYWGFERMLKLAEGRAGSVVSATGAIYAVRASLFQPVVEGVTDDFWVSTGVIAAGRRLVFGPDAVAYEPVAATGPDELARKVRVITRGLRGVVGRRALLDPRRHGFYALQLGWHKGLRRLMGGPLVVAAVVSPFLWRRGPLYRLAMVAQGAFYLAGAAGIALRGRRVGRHRALSFPAYFCLVNGGSLVAFVRVLRGRTVTQWEPRRATTAPSEAGTGHGGPPDRERLGAVGSDVEAGR